MSMIFGKYLNQSGSSYCSAMDYSKDKGHEFLALPKRNMKNRLMRLTDKLLSRKRSIIETVIDQLKNISQIEHSRHRSPINAMINVICGL